MTDKVGMMKLDFKEFSAQAIAKLINPLIRQLSLAAIRNDLSYINYFLNRLDAVALTSSGSSMRGSLGLVDDVFTFFTNENTRLLQNNQLLVLLFSIEGKDYYAQVNTSKVFATKIEVLALDPRYYARTEVEIPANLWLLSDDQVADYTSGKKIIRRLEPNSQANADLDFFVRDIVRIPDGQPDSFDFSDELVAPVILKDISRGGCSLQMHNPSQEILVKPTLCFFETTLSSRNKTGNIASFLFIKKIERSPFRTILRCSFIEALPEMQTPFLSGSETFTIECDEDHSVRISGRIANNGASLQLPLGHHILAVEWPDGTRHQETIFLSRKSEKLITVRRLKHPKIAG